MTLCIAKQRLDSLTNVMRVGECVLRHLMIKAHSDESLKVCVDVAARWLQQLSRVVVLSHRRIRLGSCRCARAMTYGLARQQAAEEAAHYVSVGGSAGRIA